jgi:hypothetical protein
MNSSVLVAPSMNSVRPLFHIQNAIYSTMMPSMRLWVGQGEGFTVNFLDYPGQTTLVKWKAQEDTAALEIWRLAT